MNEETLLSKWRFLIISALSLILFSPLSFAATINVPGDHSTIQAGIDAASNGDTVLVADATMPITIVANGNVRKWGRPFTACCPKGFCSLNFEQTDRAIFWDNVIRRIIPYKILLKGSLESLFS